MSVENLQKFRYAFDEDVYAEHAKEIKNQLEQTCEGSLPMMVDSNCTIEFWAKFEDALHMRSVFERSITEERYISVDTYDYFEDRWEDID